MNTTTLILTDLTLSEIIVMINIYMCDHYGYYVIMEDDLVDISNVLLNKGVDV